MATTEDFDAADPEPDQALGGPTPLPVVGQTQNVSVQIPIPAPQPGIPIIPVIDPDEIKKVTAEAVKAVSMPPMQKYECGRCGIISAVKKEMRFFCQTCASIRDSEVKGLQAATKNLSNEVTGVRSELAELQSLHNDLKIQMKGAEEASSRYGMEKFHLEVSAFRLSNAIRAWNAYRDHVKARSQCIPCKNNMQCPELEMLEKNADSVDPKIKCAECDKRDTALLAHKLVSEDYKKLWAHEQECAPCSRRVNRCPGGFELEMAARNRVNVASNEEYGRQVAAHLNRSINSLAHLGEGAALLFKRDHYEVVKIDLKKIPMNAFTFLGDGNHPRAAVEKAQTTLSAMNTHSSMVPQG